MPICRTLCVALLSVAALPVSFPAAHAQSHATPPDAQSPVYTEGNSHKAATTAAGDTPESAGPLATDLSAALTRKDVAKALLRVGDWQLGRLPASPQYDWTFAALYTGVMAVPAPVAGARYTDAMHKVGQGLEWQPGPRILHADDQAVGQMYLEQYMQHRDAAEIAPIRARMDAEMATPDDPAKPLWWWADALFMAPPVLADLSVATGDKKYDEYLDHEWAITSAQLYDTDKHLFTRDASFLDKHEKNGQKIFWSRGNGWVMAGLVRVIDRLPAGSPSRAKYVLQLQQMAAAVAPLQGADGLWRAGLLDQTAYPLPEVSGSGFIAYALAYGVKHHLLPEATYKPVVAKAWAGMVGHIYADGRLGCIQPIGAAPGAFTVTSSYVYGVGAFLLAGSEIWGMVK